MIKRYQCTKGVLPLWGLRIGWGWGWFECWCLCLCLCERCSATPCSVALHWLTAPVQLYNSWSLLCVWLYKHRVGWLPHAELQYWSLWQDPTATLIVFCPFLSCQSMALCVEFYPLTNHSALLALLNCQSSRRYCLFDPHSVLTFTFQVGRSTISSSSNTDTDD